MEISSQPAAVPVAPPGSEPAGIAAAAPVEAAAVEAAPVEAAPVEAAAATAGPPSGVRPRRWRRRLIRISVWALAVVVVLALVASGLVVWSVRRSFPARDGTLTLPGLVAPVTVYRDSYGIPQVYAQSEADLFRAQGYVHAQDRFWEMDFRRHITAGRLSELFGASMVPTDAFLRTLGWRRVAEQEWRLISPRARNRLQAYADGVNAWLDDHGGSSASGTKSLEYTILGIQNPDYIVERWDPVDSVAWLKAMAWDLRGNMGTEIERAALLAHGLSRDQIDELHPAYPFERNRPIVDGGFEPEASPDAFAPASYSGPDGSTPDRLWSDAAPVLGALGEAMASMPGTMGLTGAGVGSNSWVIGGSLTASGLPLLANDPHLSPSMPGIWYQVGLHCGCPYNVAGFSLSGVPGVIIGHNDRIAWGLTNLGPDVTDLYLERIDGERYFDGAGWREIGSRQEVIEVAGAAPVTITVRETGHGPLLSDRSADLLGIATRPPVDAAGSPVPRIPPAPVPSLDAGAPGVPAQAASPPYAVALRWTAADPGRTIDALFALNQAANWADFRAAAALFDVPAQNMIYADVEGNIGYQAPGRIPIRAKGDGSWPAPGWDPAYDWQGYIPFRELPNVFNPPEGVIVTANQAVIGPQYPYLITADWSYGYRSQRILDMIAERAAGGPLDVEDVRQMQFDNHNGFAATLVPALLAVPLVGSAAAARELLADWDFQQPAESPARTSAAAAFYNATLRHLLRRIFDEVPADYRPSGDDGSWEILRRLLAAPASSWWDDRSTENAESMNDILAAAMNDAVAELVDRLGDDPAGWRWGDLHTLTLENQTLGQSGIAPIERLLNRGPVPVAGGGGIVNATGWSADTGYEVNWVPSMRMIVDMSRLDASRWVQLSGNSGHAYHANYADQLELWRTGRNAPMLWERPSIEAAASHTLTLEPARAG
jgi:penicillin G amidase